MLLIGDGSHWQDPIDFGALKRAGVLGFSHKAFDIKAVPMRDMRYALRKTQAFAAGLLWAAFCFEENADGALQADDFIDAAGLDGQTALHLDLEAWATLAEAEAFITEIRAKTGVYPVVYTRAEYVRSIGGTKSAILAACQLWQADPNNDAPEPCPPWTSCFLWQRTSAVIAGVNFDRDYFNGTEDELRKAWQVATPTTSVVLLDAKSVAVFKTAGGELHSFHEPGETIAADYSTTQIVNGVTYVQSPSDFWIPSFNLPPAPPIVIPPVTPPPGAPVPMWVKGTGSVLNVRISPVSTAKAIVQIPDGTEVQATGTPLTTANHYIFVAFTWKGIDIAGYASADYLTTTAPKA